MDAFAYGWSEHALPLAIMLLLGFALAFFLRWYFWERAKDRLIEELQSNYDAAQGHVRTLENENKTLKSDLAACRKSREDLEEKQKNAMAEVVSQANELTELQEKVRKLESQKAKRDADFTAAKIPVVTAEANQKRLVELEAANAKLKGELVAQQRADAERIADLSKQIAACEAEKAKLEIMPPAAPTLVAPIVTEPEGSDLLTLTGVTEGDLGNYAKADVASITDLAEAKDEKLVSAFADSKHNFFFARQQAILAKAGNTEKLNALKTDNFALALRQDNLQIIEGIGPKIEGLLKDAGIGTWAALAASSKEELKKILDEKGGKRYQMHNPEGWPHQSKLALNSEWKALVTLQKEDDEAQYAKVEKLMFKILGITADPEDLKIIEGIGPKIEQLLKAEGIQNWEDLSKTAVEKLQAVLEKAGSRYKLAVPETWPRQAALAAEGRWAELRDYQDALQGGKTVKK
ncbi:MAG: helix-hairpin-helix domain-containing protein [Bacteroidota bacterium]